jgi:hypothetical protein
MVAPLEVESEDMSAIAKKISDVVRKALEQCLRDGRQKKLEQELEAGYLANAPFARKINDEWSAADAELHKVR